MLTFQLNDAKSLKHELLSFMFGGLAPCCINWISNGCLLGSCAHKLSVYIREHPRSIADSLAVLAQTEPGTERKRRGEESCTETSRSCDNIKYFPHVTTSEHALSAKNLAQLHEEKRFYSKIILC